jgi:hypothetical protein
MSRLPPEDPRITVIREQDGRLLVTLTRKYTHRLRLWDDEAALLAELLRLALRQPSA